MPFKALSTHHPAMPALGVAGRDHGHSPAHHKRCPGQRIRPGSRRQLLEAERGWRDIKQVIDLRPVYHRKEERIRAHVILCWLALLLARVAENTCGATWPGLRRQLDRIAVGTFTGPAGTFRQRTEITPAQAAILEQLGIDKPPRIYQLTPAATG